MSSAPVSSPTATMCDDHAGEDGRGAQRLGDRAALLDGVDDVAIDVLDDAVAGGLAGDVDRLQQRHAGADERGERARPARERDLLDDVADLHRDPQAERVPLRAALLGASSTS